MSGINDVNDALMKEVDKQRKKDKLVKAKILKQAAEKQQQQQQQQ